MSLRHAIKFFHHRGHKRTTAPASEPVTASEFRDHIVDPDMTDDEANGWIAAAREIIEENTGLALITQVWSMTLDRWPATREEWWDGWRQGAISELHGTPGAMELPRYPLQDVDDVTVYDEGSNATAVVVADTFDIDTYSTPGRMALKYGATWPVALRPTNAILIEYTAGYGDDATDVPAPLRLAVKQVAAYLYNHRGDGCTPEDALAAGRGLMGQYEVRRI